jgi:hypothetical protein
MPIGHIAASGRHMWVQAGSLAFMLAGIRRTAARCPW